MTRFKAVFAREDGGVQETEFFGKTKRGFTVKEFALMGNEATLHAWVVSGVGVSGQAG